MIRDFPNLAAKNQTAFRPVLQECISMTLTKRCLLAALMGWTCLSPAMATERPADRIDPAQPHFTINFEVFAKGLSVGTYWMTGQFTEPGAYRLEAMTEPEGIAALFVAETVHEKAIGHCSAQGIEPTRYDRIREKRGKLRETHIRFDWDANKVHSDHEGKPSEFDMTALSSDPLSLNLVMMSQLSQGKRPNRITIADKDRFKTYHLSYKEDQVIDTVHGATKTIEVLQSSPGRSRQTTLWYAPELGYLPVKIQQKKDGSELLRMEARQRGYTPVPPLAQICPDDEATATPER